MSELIVDEKGCSELPTAYKSGIVGSSSSAQNLIAASRMPSKRRVHAEGLKMLD